MSHNFIGRFFKFTSIVFENKATRTVHFDEVALKVLVSSIFIAGNGIYAYSTKNNDDIVVIKKYKINKMGYTDFMIIDNKGRHFNVNNSLWYWKWDSIEDWHKIDDKNGEQLLIKYYGWRIPVLGLFPNIVLSSNKKSC